MQIVDHRCAERVLFRAVHPHVRAELRFAACYQYPEAARSAISRGQRPVIGRPLAG